MVRPVRCFVTLLAVQCACYKEDASGTAAMSVASYRTAAVLQHRPEGFFNLQLIMLALTLTF